MLEKIMGFPQQIKDAQAIGEKIDFAKSAGKGFNKIVFCGLGGSAIGADLIRSYVALECRVPIFVNRDYTIPAFVDKDTLLIISSYSGNTEEILSAYEKGKERTSQIVTITTNGKVRELAEAGGLPCILIPKGFPPRCALAFSSIPLIILLSKMGLISDKTREIEDASNTLAELRDKELAPSVEDAKNISKSIANDLHKKYSIIYGANQHIDSVVTRWRGQLAENSKALSSTHIFPEMNHNEIVGWANPKNLMKDLVVIFLRDKADHARVKMRMEISKTIIAKENVRMIEVESKGKTLLGRIFSLIYIGDFVSLYLAILNGVDPTPVESVMYLKNELAKV
jgi:glucose/mannose-6-phosphate isomerase